MEYRGPLGPREAFGQPHPVVSSLQIITRLVAESARASAFTESKDDATNLIIFAWSVAVSDTKTFKSRVSLLTFIDLAIDTVRERDAIAKEAASRGRSFPTRERKRWGKGGHRKRSCCETRVFSWGRGRAGGSAVLGLIRELPGSLNKVE